VAADLLVARALEQVLCRQKVDQRKAIPLRQVRFILLRLLALTLMARVVDIMLIMAALVVLLVV
jgi:hypothetical protein